jgi:glutathione S-transferase
VLTLYDAPRCPYCARARIALAEKAVPYETVEIDLDDRPRWIYEKNAKGKVPVIEDGALLLPESHLIVELLEELHPSPPLLPPDPAARSAARLLVDRFDDLLGDVYYAFRRGEVDQATLRSSLAGLDSLLGEQPFLTGPDYGIADIAYVPWVLRIRDRMAVDLQEHPGLTAWIGTLEQRPAVAAEAAIVRGLA